MELREETSDAATVLTPLCVLGGRTPVPGSDRVSHNGYCGASWRDEPPSSVLFGLGVRGTNFDREAKKGGCPIPAPCSGPPGSDFRPHPDPALCSSSQQG